MLQTHVARVNQENDREGKNGKADSLTGVLDNHTDTQMGIMTNRLRRRQTDNLLCKPRLPYPDMNI